MRRLKFKNWATYGFEFLCIFIAVISAFALNNWNDNRRAAESESKILMSINYGLKKDLEDITVNIRGHKYGIAACEFFQNVVAGKEVSADSVLFNYFNLTRDFVSIQNVAGYETMKSQGLELIKNDSLRQKIISLYEYDFAVLKKLEEDYAEMQFQAGFFNQINEVLAPNFLFDEKLKVVDINNPLVISEDQKKILLIYLWKIQVNRKFMLALYSTVEEKIADVRKMIEVELK